MSYDLAHLLAGLADEATDAGISIQSQLEPLAGPGAPVKPAVYAGGKYQTDRRWLPGADEAVDVLVIDNVPSQANRMEAALERIQAPLGLPSLVLDLSGVGELPAHVRDSISGFEFPHRNADAYLRDAELDGTAFPKHNVGSALFSATERNPAPLLQYMPQALVYGFWQSHMGKKGVQTKFARAAEAEIVGYEPASIETRRLGLKGDPLNLSVDSAVSFDTDDHTTWEFTGDSKAGKAKSKDSLAEIGHGQVPVAGADAPLGAVSFRRIDQRFTVSFSRLRNIQAGSPEQNAAARSLLASLAVVAFQAAFTGGFTLRSGCDLRAVSQAATWIGGSGDQVIDGLSLDSAKAVFAEAVAHAESVGLPVGSAWSSAALVLTPNTSLTKAIRSTFGLA